MAKLNQPSRPKLNSSPSFSGERHREFDYTDGWRYVNLRIPLAMLNDLDQHLSGQQPKGHRMHWIIQAILEKLERERNV